MSELLRRLPVCMFFFWVATMPVLARDKPLVSATTSEFTPPGVRPSPSLTHFVITAMGRDWQERADECLADKGLPAGGYASVLRAIQIKNGHDHSLWFVRPTVKPFCMALYGAHLFNYFLVEQHGTQSDPQYKLVYQNGGDGFAIYSHLSHGLNDIEAKGCIALSCRAARLQFDGEHYQPKRCTLTHFDKNGSGKETTIVRPCGSDDGRDDQASGINPSDR